MVPLTVYIQRGLVFLLFFYTTYISLTIVDRSFHPEKPCCKADDKINFSNIIEKLCNTIVDGKVVSVSGFGLSPHLYRCLCGLAQWRSRLCYLGSVQCHGSQV